MVAAHIAAATENKATYIRHRAFDDAHYKALMAEYLRQYGAVGRAQIDRLLLDKLSEVLSEDQRRNKVRNLLQAMRRAGTICNDGSRGKPRWVLTERAPEVEG